MLGQRCAKFFSANPALEVAGAAPDETILFPGVTYFTIDFLNRESVKSVIKDFCPDVIINASAFTNVDLSEKERELAWKVNVSGVEYITEAARIIDAHVVHISSDYVFDGYNGPYGENDRPNPINYYGRTKLAAENVLHISGTFNTIIRTNVLYGIIPNGRLDFVRWVVESIRQEKPVNIVTDQFNNPTFIDDLVFAVHSVIESKYYGLLHIGGMDVISRYTFTQIIADVFDLDKTLITPIVTAKLQQPASRPLKSGLLIIKAQSELGFRPTDLRESLLAMKKELYP